MQHALVALLDAAARAPGLALLLIGAVAFAESLAVVGTVVPAAVVMFGAGALVGHGTLGLAVTLAVAAAGAIAGDGLSYELGRHREQRMRGSALLARHATAMAKAEALIRRHGALSVVVARFTGPVRAFVPLLAGFARMPRPKFYATNLVSALLWAPVHILPGVVFGASLQLAEAASGRLVLLLLLVAALLAVAVWLVSFTLRKLVPLAWLLRERAFAAVRTRHSAPARLLRLLLDPQRPGSQALLAALALLLASMWLFLGILEDVVSSDPLVVADHTVFTFLQQLRTAPVDRWMVRITEMGSVGVMLPLVLAVAAWLLARRCWRTAGYWIATVACSEAVVQVLKVTLGRHRPLALYRGTEQFSFPSGHATMSAVVLAYLAFLVTRGQGFAWRLGVGAVIAVYVALVGFSRLYLGAHWLSDVIGGFSFGLAAVALSAMVYGQHRVHEPLRPRVLAPLALAIVGASGIAWGAWRGPADLRQYAPHPVLAATTLPAWSSAGFRDLPAARREIAGERKEPFTIQLACPAPALLQALQRAGWQGGPGLTLATALMTLAPDPAVQQLPLLPKFDGGRKSAITLQQAAGPDARDVLRLWTSDWRIAPDATLWYGAFYREAKVRRGFGLLRQAPQDPALFANGLAAAGLQRVRTSADAAVPQLWTCRGA
jgi:membrane protein DedA with SNARE-associated domain/membrane-associated phospholipid phosphatase